MPTLKARSLAVALAALGLAALAPAPAQAQSNCNSISNVVSQIWARFGERVKAKQCKDADECLSNLQKKEELLREMIAFWNQQAQGSWATIGPRPLVVGGGYNDGNVVRGTSRMFVTQMPVDGDSVEIRITKQGGGGAKVSLAHFDGRACSQGTDVTFAKGDRDGTVKSLKLTGTKGKLVFVKVDADGAQSFDYKFTAAVK